MYDTVGMFLENSYLNESLVYNLSENINKVTGEIVIRGDIENLRIKSIGSKVSIIGSLPKFYLGNNLQQLKREDIVLVTEKLSDILKLPLIDAKIFRLDIGYNFDLKLPLPNYYNCLGNLSRFKKSTIANNETIQYCTSKKTLVFYDKVKEMKKHKQSIPNHIANKNLLRYEFRFNNRITESLNRIEVRVKDLFNEKFYAGVIDYWKDYYFKIYRVNNSIFKASDLSIFNNKTLQRQLATIGLEKIGIEEMRAMIESNKSDFKHREQFQRVKRLVQDLSTNVLVTEPQEAIKELDAEIIHVVEENKL